MKIFGKNVGRLDAQSRAVAALLLVLGGIAALPELQNRLPWPMWVLGIAMVALGVRYIMLGLKGCGTWLFGTLLDVLGVVDMLLAQVGAGRVALVLGIVVAVVGWLTAATGRCPINHLLGLDTREAGARAPAGSSSSRGT